MVKADFRMCTSGRSFSVGFCSGTYRGRSGPQPAGMSDWDSVWILDSDSGKVSESESIVIGSILYCCFIRLPAVRPAVRGTRRLCSTRSGTPPRRHPQKWLRTVENGGCSEDDEHHRQPLDRMYRTGWHTFRRSVLRNCPVLPCFSSIGSTMDHSPSVA